MRVWSVDPGDVNVGFVDAVVNGLGIDVVSIETTSGHGIIQRFEHLHLMFPPELVLIERYQLFPWLARQQGFSEFETPQLIGVLKYLAKVKGIPVVMQTASVKKKGRLAASTWPDGPPMAPRSLGSGKGAYRGPEFLVSRSTVHARDALAHVWYWATTAADSPMKKE